MMKFNPQKERPITRGAAIDYADRWLSLWIRARDGRICKTCGSRQDPQCGHYISRYFEGTRWDEHNCICQCAGCNAIAESSTQAAVEIGLVLVDMWGEGILDELRRRQYSDIHYTTEQILAIGTVYKQKYLEMNR